MICYHVYDCQSVNLKLKLIPYFDLSLQPLTVVFLEEKNINKYAVNILYKHLLKPQTVSFSTFPGKNSR